SRWFCLWRGIQSCRFLLLPGSDGLDDFAGLPADMIRLLDAVFDLSQVIECRHELMPKFANSVDCDWGMIFHGETMPHSGSVSESRGTEQIHLQRTRSCLGECFQIDDDEGEQLLRCRTQGFLVHGFAGQEAAIGDFR